MKQLLFFFVAAFLITNLAQSMELRSGKHKRSQQKEMSPASKKTKLYQATLLVKEHTRFYQDYKEITPYKTIVAGAKDGYCPFFFFQAPQDQAVAISNDARVKRLRELVVSTDTDHYKIENFIMALYCRDINEETPGYTSE